MFEEEIIVRVTYSDKGVARIHKETAEKLIRCKYCAKAVRLNGYDKTPWCDEWDTFVPEEGYCNEGSYED